MSDRLAIGLTIHVTAYTGWGMVALGLVKALAARPDVDLHFWSIDWKGIDPLTALKLRPIHDKSMALVAPHLAKPGTAIPFDGVLIHADGNHFNSAQHRIVSDRNMGLMVFEDTAFTPEELQRGRERYRWLVTASRWNQSVLAGYGLPSHLIHQGIDTTVFHPAPTSGLFRDRFVVFSGGKLEYRKGQDIVLAAFRQFHATHPDALLVTCWQNPWPALAVDMTLNGNVEHEPERGETSVDVEGWFEDNGLPDDAALDLGLMPNAFLGPIIREADVAVFMSRAEGATNLVAMEAIASGVPTILSNGTGHADLVARWVEPMPALPKRPSVAFQGIEGWAECCPSDLVEILERRYAHRDVKRGPEACVPSHSEYADNLITLLSDGRA